MEEDCMYIGKKIEAIRKGQKMSLTELSQKSGVQLATLSRIENMKMVGTLESHIQIAKALGTDVTEMYRGLDQDPPILDAGPDKNATDIFTHSEHSSYEILTKNVLKKKMMPVLIRIAPNGKTNVEQNTAGTEKFIFILEGVIEAQVSENKFRLGRHNTFYFDASLPHHFINKGKSTARILCVGTPVSL